MNIKLIITGTLIGLMFVGMCAACAYIAYTTSDTMGFVESFKVVP